MKNNPNRTLEFAKTALGNLLRDGCRKNTVFFNKYNLLQKLIN